MASIPMVHARQVRALVEKQLEHDKSCALEAQQPKVQLGKTWADPEISPTPKRRIPVSVQQQENAGLVDTFRNLYYGPEGAKA